MAQMDISPHHPEMSEGAARLLMERAVNAALNRVYREPHLTHGGAARTEIEKGLLSEPPQKGMGPDALAHLLENSFDAYIRDYRHPLHFGHQRPASLVAGAVADLTASMSNATVSVYEASPFSVALEKRTIEWLLKLFELPDSAAGTFTNGGSESTLTALLCARERIKAVTPGFDLTRLVLFTGSHAHYSIKRAAHVLGLHSDSVIEIPCDAYGRMEMSGLKSALERAELASKTPLAICATAGTTANAAFDDLATCQEIASEKDIWLHVDACHGGAAIISDKHRHKLAGIEKANSFVWNPHKLLWVSPPCSCLFVREKKYLHSALFPTIAGASYMVPEKGKAANDHDDNSDGDPLQWTLACTRQFSAFKVYAALMVYGISALASRLERMCDLALELHEKIKNHSRFETYCSPEFNITCFRSTLSGADNDFHKLVREELADETDTYLTGVKINGVYWLRAHLISERTTSQNLDEMLKIVDEKFVAHLCSLKTTKRVG